MSVSIGSGPKARPRWVAWPGSLVPTELARLNVKFKISSTWPAGVGDHLRWPPPHSDQLTARESCTCDRSHTALPLAVWLRLTLGVRS